MAIEERLIYDVGLHQGDDAAYYLSQGFRVLGVEANPALAKHCQARFAREIEQGRLTVLNVGIAEHTGTADFWVSEHDGLSSFDFAIASRLGSRPRAVQIPTVRFRDILAQYGVPYYLKIDIEGFDKLCIIDLRPSALPKYVSLETECVADGETLTEEQSLETLRLLHEVGYRHFKLVDQMRMSTLTVQPSLRDLVDLWATRFACSSRGVARVYRALGGGPLARWLTTKSLLERRYGRSGFNTSGVWGEETLGSWMNYEEATRCYLYHRRRREAQARRRAAANTPSVGHFIWCDWHARA